MLRNIQAKAREFVSRKKKTGMLNKGNNITVCTSEHKARETHISTLNQGSSMFKKP